MKLMTNPFLLPGISITLNSISLPSSSVKSAPALLTNQFCNMDLATGNKGMILLSSWDAKLFDLKVTFMSKWQT